jgi:tRNA A58 N-methylase Trm61
MEEKDNFLNITKYVKQVGHIYETGDFSFYFYGLLKMIKPQVVVELGTGYGATAFLAAQALKENGKGKVISHDDGSQWQENYNYENFIGEKVKEFELAEQLDFRKKNLDLITLNELKDLKEINVIFNDINAQPKYFFSILNFLLPRINKEVYFFIDRGATFWPNFCAIELTLEKLNYGKIPRSIYQFVENAKEFEELIKKYKFSVQYVKQDTDSDQDRFAVIKIEEFDIQVI